MSNKMKGVYLCSCKARHDNYSILYNDVDSKYNPDLCCSASNVTLKNFDFIIATPPCNFWSKANPYYLISKYAQNTRHLLPETIIKCVESGKPFIIENVKNYKRFSEYGIFDLINKYGLFIQNVGRHIYITNQLIDLSCPQQQDFKYGGKRVNNDGYNQGGKNVHDVIEIWLKYIHDSNSERIGK